MSGRAIQEFATGGYTFLSQKAPAAADAVSKSIVGAVERAHEVNWKELANKTVEAVKENPRIAIVPAATVAGAVVAPVLMGPVLGAVGFSTVGPVAGSWAASLMSSGAVGPVYSLVQSAAMGGYGVAGVTSMFSGAGAVAGALASTASTGTGAKNETAVSDPEEEQKEEEGGETMTGDTLRPRSEL
ncbi:hypothetical protein GGS20DRAFT_581425 [Poronia punctata]|nr:hypothetical protein GGS20DRAFT_581425 [Poronia punctata]